MAMLVLVPWGVAQVPSDQTVDAVAIQGLERVSEQMVRSQMEVKAGQTANPRAVARDLRRLYGLGFFATIRVDLDSSGGRTVLTYLFVEKRLIEEVTVIGNDKVKTREIRGVLSWKEGDSFDREGYGEERDAILDLYRSKGFLNASVDIVVRDTQTSRVQVTYLIDEGKKARIRSIDFSGNSIFTDRKLRKIIKTRRARWFLGGKYDEDNFEVDLRKIVEEYGNYGHLEADVPSTEFAYSPNGKKLEITIRLSEGPEYTVESLEIAGNIVYDDDELMRTVRVHAGDVHNRAQVEDDADFMRKGYEDGGYVNARVTPQVTLDREKKTTHVVHQITENELIYIREIKVTGNSVTKDDVVRRSILIAPGDRYDGTALRASNSRLEASRYFEETRITLEDVEGDDRHANLLVDVDEGRTGNFNFGGGYSTEEKLGGFTEVKFTNFDITNWPSFSGGGQQFSTRLSLGAVRTQYNISFTDPEIGGYPFALGFDFYDESYHTTGGSSFTQNTQGAQLRLGKSLSPYLSVRTALRFSDVDITDLGTGIFLTRDYRILTDPGTTISNTWGIQRNTLDHYRDPTTGSTHSFAIEVAGLGGDNKFIKFDHDSTWYRSYGAEKKWVFSLRFREGLSAPYGSSELVPLQDRYFAGGTSTVRGYDTREIGPKERTFVFLGEREAIGGELRLITNVEAKYKLSDLLRFYTFFDLGGVWKEIGDFDLDGYRYSVGVGFGIDVPRIGPMRIDYGFPLNPDDDQGNGEIHLTTGFRF